MYKINVYHTHIEISDYIIGENETLEKMLSVWDDTSFRYKPIGYSYDESAKVLRIARGVSLSRLENMFGEAPNIIYKPNDYNEISMRVTAKPRNDLQREAVAFLIGENSFHHTKKYSQLLLELPPGSGKTYIASAAMQFFRMKTLIIVHTNKIKEQWLETFEDMTDLSDKHVYVIKGSSDVIKLMNSDTSKYKVFVILHGTLTSFGNRYGWDMVQKLVSSLNIGLKIIDEAHLYFANVMKIDMYTNVKKSVYLTATFERSDYKEQRVFKLCMSNVVSYKGDASKLVDDEETTVVSKSTRKHIMYLALIYNSHPSLDYQTYMFTMRKFNKNRYAEYIIQCKKFFDALEYVAKYFSTKAGKMLILSSTVESCNVIRKFIETILPYKVVREYHSKVPKSEKESAFDADIICSTPLSAGTGTDIPKLRVVINTESYSSKVSAEQVSGRLREYSKTENTYYIELIDKGFNSTYAMYMKRRPVFKKKCLKMTTLDFDKIDRGE